MEVPSYNRFKETETQSNTENFVLPSGKKAGAHMMQFTVKVAVYSKTTESGSVPEFSAAF